MSDYIQTDHTGRVVAWTFDEKYAVGFQEVNLPDGFDVDHMGDWVYRDGIWTHDPLPEPDPQPTLDERVTTIEGEMNALTSAFEVTD